jgi:glycosyltransferase involved in cell wall biosynthesis
MPYFMHPMQYQYDARNRLNELRSSNRRVKIFFSGNIAEENYVNRLPGSKLTRSEICKALETMSGVECVTDKEHFNRVFSSSGFTNGCVINDRLVYAISDEEWLPTLALCDFFLCLPGSRMPLCHNVIEAMAVGAIPILNYSEWFEPPLEDGKNCIEFATVNDLRSRLAEILNYDPEIIEAMRQRVVEYYDRHLTPLSFRKRLEEAPKRQVRVLVNTESSWETEFAEPQTRFSELLTFEHLTG